jgi:hypothetical protein
VNGRKNATAQVGAQIMGHDSLDTTKIYIQATREDLRLSSAEVEKIRGGDNAFKSLHPHNALSSQLRPHIPQLACISIIHASWANTMPGFNEAIVRNILPEYLSIFQK